MLLLKGKEHEIQEQVCPSHIPLLGLSMGVLSSGWDCPELSGVQTLYFCWYWSLETFFNDCKIKVQILSVCCRCLELFI